MFVEQALLYELTQDAGLTAHVGERIYPGNAPQTVATPYIVFFKVDSSPEQSHQGNSHLERARFQFDIFDASIYECKLIAEHLQSILQGLNELIGVSPYVRVEGIIFLGEGQLYENEDKLYHLIEEFEVPYET